MADAERHIEADTEEMLLDCTKSGVLTSEEATDVLYELVTEGMNLHPQVYTQIQRKLEELGV